MLTMFALHVYASNYSERLDSRENMSGDAEFSKARAILSSQGSDVDEP